MPPCLRATINTLTVTSVRNATTSEHRRFKSLHGLRVFGIPQVLYQIRVQKRGHGWLTALPKLFGMAVNYRLLKSMSEAAELPKVNYRDTGMPTKGLVHTGTHSQCLSARWPNLLDMIVNWNGLHTASKQLRRSKLSLQVKLVTPIYYLTKFQGSFISQKSKHDFIPGGDQIGIIDWRTRQ